MLLVCPKNLLIGEDRLKLLGMATIFFEITKGIVNDKEAENSREYLCVQVTHYSQLAKSQAKKSPACREVYLCGECYFLVPSL